MNKDNIQELLKPRYKVIADYPEIERHNIRIGDVITISESAMYADKTQDGTPVVAIDHEIFPAVFRRLEWWEDRDVKDMPEYVNYNNGEAFYKVKYRLVGIKSDTLQVKTVDIPIDKWETWTEIEYNHLLPATETEYLNQNQKPTPGKKLTQLTENIFAVEIPGDAINILVGRYFIYWDTNGSSNELALPPGSYTLLFLSLEAGEDDWKKHEIPYPVLNIDTSKQYAIIKNNQL